MVGCGGIGSTPTGISDKLSEHVCAYLRACVCVGTDARGRGKGPAGMGGAGNWVTGSDVINPIPGSRNSGKAILGVPILARIHYNLPYMKY